MVRLGPTQVREGPLDSVCILDDLDVDQILVTNQWWPLVITRIHRL